LAVPALNPDQIKEYNFSFWFFWLFFLAAPSAPALHPDQKGAVDA
jgi:hypothetical protein